MQHRLALLSSGFVSRVGTLACLTLAMGASACAGGDEASTSGAATFSGGETETESTDTSSEEEESESSETSVETSADGADTGAGCPDGYVPDYESEPDENCAVFVDAENGDDVNDGSAEAPVATLETAIDIAVTQELPVVIVAVGEYAESVTLADGVSLFGGYASGSWTAGAGVSEIVSSEPVAVRAWALTQPTLVGGHAHRGGPGHDGG